MKLVRLAVLLLTCSGFCLAVNKDMLALQRELEDKINALQNDMNTKLSVMSGMLQAIQNDTRDNAKTLAGMQDSVTSSVARSMTPVNGLSNRVDSVGEDVRSLKDALADITARMERMDAKITDLKNQMQIMQSPPPSPSPSGVSPNGLGLSSPSGLSPQSATVPQLPTPAASGPTLGPKPPAGMSADHSFAEAMRDLQTGKSDLAYNEFQQYLTYFPNTEFAAKAQYYLGEIDYNRGNYPNAIRNFDSVLERYPENPKTADAHLMKAYALLKANERNRAVQEFRILVSNYPHTDDARKAIQQLRSLGMSPSSGPASGAGQPTAARP
jgi:tol-pal system protein YbgF